MTLAGVELDVRRGVVVARVSGDVDASNADRVLADVSAAVPNDAAGVVLDLSGTRYLDSAGITVLFELNARLETRRQRLRVAAAPDAPLRRILELTGVAALVPLDDSAETAVEAMAGGSPAPASGTTLP